METELQMLAAKRLQEALAFPIPDTWAKTLWEHGLDAGLSNVSKQVGTVEVGPGWIWISPGRNWYRTCLNRKS